MLNIIWGIIQAAMLPGLLLWLVASSERRGLRELVGFACLIALTGLDVYHVISLSQRGPLAPSAYWLGPNALPFAILGLGLAFNFIMRRMRLERRTRIQT